MSGDNSGETLGPAMRALNERQRAFVWAIVQTPGISYADAARQAGYVGKGEGEKALNVEKAMGHRLAHLPSVIAAMHEVAGKHLRMGALAAARELVAAAGDPKHQNHKRAVESVLDRTGFAPQTKVAVDHQHQHLHARLDGMSPEAMTCRILELCQKMGANPEIILGPDKAAAAAELARIDRRPTGLIDVTPAEARR